VALVRTKVSEEHITSIIRVTRISELGTTLASSKEILCEKGSIRMGNKSESVGGVIL
jgi:hypothetical protein